MDEQVTGPIAAPGRPATRPLRASAAAVDRWLDRLDADAGAVRAWSRRRAERHPFRGGRATLRADGLNDTPLVYEAAVRNISREGVGLLTGCFIYPGAPSRVRLRSCTGEDIEVRGRVVRCRYLLGSGSLHEVGVALESALDVESFVPHARRLRLMLVSPDEEMPGLLRSFLRDQSVEVVWVPAGEDWLEGGDANGEPDAALVDIDDAVEARLASCRRLRERGYVRPIIALSVDIDPQIEAACRAAGCTGYLAKPILLEDVQALVSSLLGPLLLSTLSAEPALVPLINKFVDDLRRVVVELGAARESGDLPRLARLVRQLRARGGSYGFPEISAAAARVQSALASGDRVAVSTGVNTLLDCCLRARPSPVRAG